MWRRPAVHLAFQHKALSSAAALYKKHELFDRILIANRGEIALRVMRTCKRLGIETVAVHSDVDALAEHTKAADYKYCIGPAPSKESYLKVDKIIEACKATGAQAVHPGYGFLSERHYFAQALEDNGIVFIGPHPAALKQMGDKLESKRIAAEAKVNTIPGYRGEIKDPDHAVEIARQVGYPVMIKAAAGGGGKGMRLAWNDEEARDGFRFSKNEAISSFNDGRLLIEKFIEEPRHIEIQLLADGKDAVYLNERECSIQRRNQKVIEEAPSTFLDPATRKAMGEQACSLARAVGYQTAGTVEFLVDKHRKFYFLEMNTRLQVEHAISEMITGVDIVEHMIRIAAGQKLALKQSDIGINGWAFEARVYAEDPFRFLPSTGRLSTYRDPSWVDPVNVRVDSAVVEGSDISIYYDPMICKLVTHGPTRQNALDLMVKALDNYVIKGVNHNIPLLRDILTQPKFVAGDLTTNFIPEVYPKGFKGHTLTAAEYQQLVVSAAVMAAKRHLATASSAQSIPEFVVTLGGAKHKATIKQSKDGFAVSIDGAAPVTVGTDWTLGRALFHASLGNGNVTIQHVNHDGHALRLRFMGTEYDLLVRTTLEQKYSEMMPVKPPQDLSRRVLSPMPGTIISVNVTPGSQVAAGVEVAVIEAMKMQNKLLAPRAGTVKAVLAKVGDTVEGDQLIIEFEPEAAPASA